MDFFSRCKKHQSEIMQMWVKIMKMEVIERINKNNFRMWTFTKKKLFKREWKHNKNIIFVLNVIVIVRRQFERLSDLKKAFPCVKKIEKLTDTLCWNILWFFFVKRWKFNMKRNREMRANANANVIASIVIIVVSWVEKLQTFYYLWFYDDFI
jgi:hypothetical protein